jgi:hypothetical protein
MYLKKLGTYLNNNNFKSELKDQLNVFLALNILFAPTLNVKNSIDICLRKLKIKQTACIDGKLIFLAL